MKATKQIDIYITKKRNVRLIDVVQNDTGIQLVFTVQDFTVPSGATATLYVQKPSGKFVFQKDGITVSDNTITVDLENQAITEHGKVPYQLSITSGSDEFTTFTGLMMVEKSLKDAGATESKSVIRAFDEIVSDHVAEFQTKAEQIVQACIATIPEDYAVMEAKVNELASGIKGSVSGAVVVADDVSPVAHRLNVKVHGKNLIPYGTITFTKNKSYLLNNPLPAGTYTISAHITSNDTDGVYSAVSINNKNEVMKYVALKRDVRVSSTFTVDKPITNIDFCAAYNYSQGEEDSATWADIQLERGSAATAYEPYIDPATVTVRRCGKNLLNPNRGSSSGKGLTLTNNGDGSFTINGTATAAASFGLTNLTLNPMCLHKGVTYTQSVVVLAGSMNGVAVVPSVEDGDGAVTWNYFSNNQTKTPEKHYRFRGYEIYVENGKTVDLKFKVQLEVGAVATAYEPYNGAEYIPAADGTVSGLTSVSPNMTILTDTEGAIVECEYIIDTKTYIDRKISEILKDRG